MGATPAVDDAWYIGYASPFAELEYTGVGRAAVGVYTITWDYYSTGDTWRPLTVLVDDTDSWQIAGDDLEIVWHIPIDWKLTTVTIDGSDESWYWARARISSFTSLATEPYLSAAFMIHGAWWAYVESLPGNSSKVLSAYYGGPTNFTTTHQILTGWNDGHEIEENNDASQGGGLLLEGDHAALEPGFDTFTLDWSGVIDMTAPQTTNRDSIFDKEGAIRVTKISTSQIKINATSSAGILAGTNVSAMSTGYHRITVSNATGPLVITVDGIIRYTTPSDFVGLADTTFGFGAGRHNTTPVIDNIKWSIGGVTAFEWDVDKAQSFGKIDNIEGTSTYDPYVVPPELPGHNWVYVTTTAFTALASPRSLTQTGGVADLVLGVDPGDLFSTSTTINIPFFGLIISQAFGAADIPIEAFWIPFMVVMAVGLGGLTLAWSKNILFAMFVAGIILVLFSYAGVVPQWFPLVYGIVAFSVVILRRDVGD